MNILVACEESQRVCSAFRQCGHNAFSCDVIMCSGGHPDWHIWSDVSSILNPTKYIDNCFNDFAYGIKFKTCDGVEHYVQRWDMIVAFPPCTYLTKCGASYLYKNGQIDNERFNLGQLAAKFFLSIYNADCDKICIENPVPIKIFNLPAPSQCIQPYYFGVPVSKKTYLWLKGLPYLCPTNVVEPIYTFATYPLFKNSHGKYRQRNRSKTFIEVANAMALSWG